MPPIINCAEHAWVLNDADFPFNPELSNCPNSRPEHEESAENHLFTMQIYGVDKLVISQVCYYGRDNTYVSHCIRKYPGRFAAVGLLVGHRLFPPDHPDNPAQLEYAIKEQGLAGLRLSPIYDRDVVWLNDPVSYPLWRKAEELGAVFNFFLAPHQVGQVADMAARFPGVKVVIDHLAMIDISRPDDEGFGPLLDMHRLPNVFIRTSMHNPSQQRPPFKDVWPYLERVYDAYGAQRMLWGNFYEMLIIQEMIPFFSEADKAWILGGTAEGIYF
jgi:predicted TIM-barrel fold metal-dependent hydrolase